MAKPITIKCSVCGKERIISSRGKRKVNFCRESGECPQRREYRDRKNKNMAVYRGKIREILRQKAKDYYWGNKSIINQKQRKYKKTPKQKESMRIRKIKDRAELKALRHVLSELGVYESIKKEIDYAVKG